MLPLLLLLWSTDKSLYSYYDSLMSLVLLIIVNRFSSHKIKMDEEDYERVVVPLPN